MQSTPRGLPDEDRGAVLGDFSRAATAVSMNGANEPAVAAAPPSPGAAVAVPDAASESTSCDSSRPSRS